MSLALIGYRGTGKTTIARLLAEGLSWGWSDADAELESRAGKTIATIFAEDGEAAFRDLESVVIDDLSKLPKQIIATGGGVVMRDKNRRSIGRFEHRVWLRADAETIHTRLATDAATAGQRPDLTASGGLGEIRKLLDQRRPFYQECATLEVDTQGRTPAVVAAEILAQLDDLGRT
jgi:shikimate kinase